jgi:hypothetical protein
MPAGWAAALMTALLTLTAVPATRVETTQIGPAPDMSTPAWSRCPEWFDTALAVGWPPDQMQVVDYVIHRESRCNPHARNSQSCGGGNHALGLMQLCGWGGAELYDPVNNLTKGLELWQRSGWHPWCLRGDPMTGPC